MTKIEQIVKELNLEPHPEGGFFKETYRSEGIIGQDVLEKQYQGDRNYSTGIYFLLTSENFSAFHKIKQDEMWHFYDGSPLCIHSINPEGIYKKTMLGRNFSAGETPQYLVKGGYWFAASVPQQNTYSLVGCTVAPGFDFADFELPKAAELIKQFPNHQKIIKDFTRI